MMIIFTLVWPGNNLSSKTGCWLLLSVFLFLLAGTPTAWAGWTEQASGTTQDLNRVYFPVDNNTGYIVGANGTILKTTNGGSNWSPQTSNTAQTLYGLYFLGSVNTGFAVGGNGTILKTTDGGTNWVVKTTGIYPALYSIHFPGNGSIGYAVGDGGTVLKTTNGGENWSPQTSNTTETLRSIVFPVDTNTGFASGGGGVIIKTINGGTTWTVKNTEAFNTLSDLYFFDNTTGYAAGSSGSVEKTTNGGESWFPADPGPGWAMTEVQFLNANTGFIIGYSGTILRTDNGGVSWVLQRSETGLFQTGMHFPVDATTGWIVGWSGLILKTTDGGALQDSAFHPTSDGSNTGFTAVGCPNRWDCVNDQPGNAGIGIPAATDSASYISGGGARNTFNLNNGYIPAGHLATEVKVVAKLHKPGGGQKPTVVLTYQRMGTDGAPVESPASAQVDTGCCTDVTYAWSNLRWSPADIDNLEIGLRHNSGGDVALSQMYTFVTSGPSITIGDGTSPSNKSRASGSTNHAVSSFTLTTGVGTDFLNRLTVTRSGTGTDTDVAANGVKLWQDNGTTPNEWDSGDTQIGTGVTFASGVATFSGLNIPVSTSSTQYLITYDLAAGAVNGRTLLAAVTGARVGNVLVNNDNADATLTVSPTCSVTNTNDSGAGSLRQCMTGIAAGTAITFNIPGPGNQSAGGDSWWRITLTSGVLPQITAANITIDGGSQTTNRGNTNSRGPEIEVFGNGLTGNVFNINNVSGTTIQNLVINGISGGYPDGNGILLQGNTAAQSKIYGNYIGTDAIGENAIPNNYCGIHVNGSFTNPNDNDIGGSTAGQGNLISGNTSCGVYVNSADDNRVRGNIIGLNRLLTAKVGNGGKGLNLTASNNTVVGGSSTREANYIGGNYDGLYMDSTCSNSLVYGNVFGTGMTGTENLGNTEYGINANITATGSNTRFGGLLPGQGNTIAFNGFDGIRLQSGTGSGIRIEGNTVRNNTMEGIEVSSDDVSIVKNLLYGNGTTQDAILINTTANATRIYHNTIHGNGRDGIEFRGTNGVIKSNIITSNGGYGINLVGGTLSAEAYNLITANPTALPNSLGQVSGLTAHASDLNVNPLYSNVATKDFTLQTTSPAVNRGCNLGTAGDNTSCDDASDEAQSDLTAGANPNFYGFAPDMGAFENSSVTNTCNVSVTTDGNNYSTLRGCITWANGNAGTDNIYLPASTYQLTSTGAAENLNVSGDLDITESLNIVGEGAATTIINGNATVLAQRILHVTAGNVTLTDLSLQNDNTEVSSTGGGIQNDGTSLTLTRVRVSGNRSTGHGGGIYTAGTLTLNDVELTNNQTTGGVGGGIYSLSVTVTVNGATVNNNSGPADGAAIRSGGILNATNTTISNNNSTAGSTISNNGNATFTNCTIYGNTGGTIINIGGGSTTTFKNTILANPGFQNCQQAFTSSGGNLEAVGNSCGFNGGTDQNTVSLANLNIDPTLKNNGGLTKTHALLSGSFAIDRGITSGAPATDQRGSTRGYDGNGIPNNPQPGDYDVGAFELSAPSVTTTIGDGTSPSSRGVWPGGAFFGVDAFTLQTSSGGDTLGGLTATFSGTNAADVAANGVLLWRDDGTTPNLWDSNDTLLGTTSFVGNTATYTGLTEPITTTVIQYLLTYNLATTAAAGNTLQGSITAATVSNSLVNNDDIDATLTVDANMVHETSVYKTTFLPGTFRDLLLKKTSSPAADLLTSLTMANNYADLGAMIMSWDPDATVTTLLDNSVVKRLQMSGKMIDAAGDSFGPSTAIINFYEDRIVFDLTVNLAPNPAGTDYLFMTYGVWDDVYLDETFRWSSNNSGAYATVDPATNFNSGNVTAPISFQTLFELGATDGLINATLRNISNYSPAQLKNSDPDTGAVDIAFQKVNPVIGSNIQTAVMYSFDTTTGGFDTVITEGRQDDFITAASISYAITGGDGSGNTYNTTSGSYTLDDGSANDRVKFNFQIGGITRYAPVFEITNWNSAAPEVIGVGGLSKNIGVDYNAAVSGTTLYLQYLGNLSADTIFDIPPSGPAVSGIVYTDEGTTTIANGSIVRLLINGVNAGTASTSGGAYSIATAGLTAGDALLVYLDNNNGTATDATTVTVSNGSALAGLNLYVDHLIVRHDDAGSLSNALINTARGSYSDTEILCSVSGGNLTVSGAGSKTLVPAGHSFTPGGNVTTAHFKNLGTVTAGAGVFTLSGSWNNSGTFTAGTSTVLLNGSNQSLTGDTTFHHLSKSVVATATLTFAAGSTTTVTGTATLNGASGNLLSLRSSTPGTQWKLTLNTGAAKAISFVDVQDSDASGSAAALRPISPASSIDSLNNLSWFVNSSDIVINGTFTDWCNGTGNEICINDEAGPDDWNSPAKLDITRFGLASNTTDTLFMLMGFDDTSLPNPSTACVLIDTPTPVLDNKIDKTVCVTVSNAGVTEMKLFNCDNSITGGCGSATLNKSYTSANWGWSNSVAGPWNTDTFVEVAIPFADLGFVGNEIILTSLTSYASSSLLKSPKDSVFGPGQNYDDRILYDIGSGGGGTIPGPGTPVIAGNVYVNEGVGSIGAGKTVHLLVNGTSVGSNTTDAAGGYFIATSAASAGQTLLVYIDNDGSYQGTSATVFDGSNLTDLDIYAGHMMTRHDNAGSLSNALLGTAKGGSADPDILYAVASGNLTVSGAGTTLYLPVSHSFTPGGAVTTPNLKSLGTFAGGSGVFDINGNLTIAGGSYTASSANTSVSGNLSLSAGSFAHNNGTVILDGTGQAIAGSITFRHLSKSVASADTLTFTAGATTTVTGTCTLNGASGQLLSLRSSTPGNRWNLTLPSGASKAISLVDVQDSDASGSAAALLVINPPNSVGSGNTVAWFLPSITVVKSADRTAANPGQVIIYTVQVSNPGSGAALDVVLDDLLSPFTAWSLDSYGAGVPFQFTEGAPASGLTLGTASYSNNNGSTWVYLPVSTGGGAPAGYDGNVTNWKIPMVGTMNAGGGFTLKYMVRVK